MLYTTISLKCLVTPENSTSLTPGNSTCYFFDDTPGGTNSNQRMYCLATIPLARALLTIGTGSLFLMEFQRKNMNNSNFSYENLTHQFPQMSLTQRHAHLCLTPTFLQQHSYYILYMYSYGTSNCREQNSFVQFES